MGLTAKSKSNISKNWGMGFLLVLFPEETATSTTTAAAIDEKPSILSSSPSRSFKRSNSSSPIISKAQSTISICVLFVFLTLLLFTLSNFEPTTAISATTINSRRFLSRKLVVTNSTKRFRSHALQGMGTLFRRGTRSMNDLVVAHLSEDIKEDDFRIFLRSLHRSGLTAKADFVFIDGYLRFGEVIEKENELFLKLVQNYSETKELTRNSSFDLSHFVKNSKKEFGEPLWGKRTVRNNHTNVVEDGGINRLSYGSIVGFQTSELDPENSLSGFLDSVPMSLRRWACYPMLLGRLRRNFKHAMLVDAKKSVIVGDPLTRIRTRSPESVQIMIKQEKPPQSHSPVNPAILMGGTRGIRRLSNAMLTEIVRATMQQHKKKNSVTEAGILSQLVGNNHILKDVKISTTTELVQEEASSLSEFTARVIKGHYPTIQRGNSNYHDISFVIRKLICSCEVDTFVYKNYC